MCLLRPGRRAERALGVEAEFLEQPDEGYALRGRERRGGALYVARVLGENARDEPFPLRGKVNDARPSVGPVRAALDEPLCLEPVDSRRDGAARELHLSSDGVDRQRALVEQRLEDCEVAAAD